MKTTFIALVGAVMLFSACGNESEKAAEDTTQQETMEQETMEQEMQTAEASFYCPMKCEGETTYTENVGCPVCGMDLVEADVDVPAVDPHEGHDHAPGEHAH